MSRLWKYVAWAHHTISRLKSPSQANLEGLTLMFIYTFSFLRENRQDISTIKWQFQQRALLCCWVPNCQKCAQSTPLSEILHIPLSSMMFYGGMAYVGNQWYGIGMAVGGVVPSLCPAEDETPIGCETIGWSFTAAPDMLKTSCCSSACVQQQWSEVL